MSCPMFMYGLTAGSVIPLSIVYMMRPESLKNLFDLISSSLLIAFNWSEGVAQRFNLSNDLFFNNDINQTISIKMYSCYTIEYWYNIFSWIIYFSFILSLILFILNQRFKNSEEDLFHNNNNEYEYRTTDFVFYYFCIFILAMTSILIRILMEHYLLGYLKPFTIVYLLWYIVSFAIFFCILEQNYLPMNETNLTSIIFGIIVGFYSTIFLLCLSDIVYLSKEMIKIKDKIDDIRNIYTNQSLLNQIPSINYSHSKNSLISCATKKLSGQLCLSYNEQRQILDYINFICNMSILIFTSYSLYIYGIGTHHGLKYRFLFFLFKLLLIILSIWLNLYFKQGLPNDIFLYIWIDINCIVSIYRSLHQTI
ncbi:unnamed protein product [Rotaria sp. Silwood1]|nr:unnamed protein product [Rotaria sp. Silwood1]